MYVCVDICVYRWVRKCEFRCQERSVKGVKSLRAHSSEPPPLGSPQSNDHY